MVNTSLTFQFQDGQTLDFVPKNIKPFGVEDILKSFGGAPHSYELKMSANNPIVNGIVEEGVGKIRATVIFERNPSPYALVPGGWLPMPLAVPRKFLVDRNVIAQLKKIKNGTARVDAMTVGWWARFFQDGTAAFNALPYAWESNNRRTPTYDEFCSSMDDGVRELKAAFPLCNIVEFDSAALNSVYETLSRFQSRQSRETKFLEEVCCVLASRVAKGRELPVLKKVIRAAKASGVLPDSLSFVAALSCLYDDNAGNQFSIGRALLKPKIGYSSGMAFNAISDMRHIEVAAAGYGYFGSESFHLTTCDKALAAFWCATTPIVEFSDKSDFAVSYHLSNSLMPRLSPAEFEGVVGAIWGAV